MLYSVLSLCTTVSQQTLSCDSTDNVITSHYMYMYKQCMYYNYTCTFTIKRDVYTFELYYTGCWTNWDFLSY